MSWRTIHISVTLYNDVTGTYGDGGGFSNFDVPLEDSRVHKAQLEGSDGHCGRDGAKVEDGLVLQQDKVVECIDTAGESVKRHLA